MGGSVLPSGCRGSCGPCTGPHMHLHKHTLMQVHSLLMLLPPKAHVLVSFPLLWALCPLGGLRCRNKGWPESLHHTVTWDPGPSIWSPPAPDLVGHHLYQAGGGMEPVWRPLRTRAHGQALHRL